MLKYAYQSPRLPAAAAYVDYFFDRAYDEAGKEHRRALMEQLRQQTDSRSFGRRRNERKSFDANEAFVKFGCKRHCPAVLASSILLSDFFSWAGRPMPCGNPSLSAIFSW